MLFRSGAFVITAAMVCSTAWAANFTPCADELYALGLFSGKSVENEIPDYALDAPCTRAEAAVMLVRLLGKQQGNHHFLCATVFSITL